MWSCSRTNIVDQMRLTLLHCPFEGWNEDDSTTTNTHSHGSTICFL